MSTRNFKLIGAVDGECTGTITLNGTQIFNGTFTGCSWSEPDWNTATPMCTGSMTFNDAADVVMPVVITTTGGTGKILIGMFQWNQAWVINPALTPEEASYANVPTDEVPAEILASVQAKGGFEIRSATAYDYGDNSELAFENRSNISLDGVSPPAGFVPNNGIAMGVGQTLTLDTTVFAGPQA